MKKIEKLSKKLCIAGCISILTIATYGCGTDDTTNPEASVEDVDNNMIDKNTQLLGALDKNVYTNEFFGMTIEFPKDSYSISDDERISEMEQANQVMNDVGEDFTAENLNGFVLFETYAIDPLEATGYNPLIGMYAEKMTDTTMTAKGYLDITKANLESLYFVGEDRTDNDFITEGTATLGGVEFATLSMVSDTNDGESIQYQDFYCTIMNGYALSIKLNFQTEEERLAMVEVIEGIEFE